MRRHPSEVEGLAARRTLEHPATENPALLVLVLERPAGGELLLALHALGRLLAVLDDPLLLEKFIRELVREHARTSALALDLHELRSVIVSTEEHVLTTAK